MICYLSRGLSLCVVGSTVGERDIVGPLDTDGSKVVGLDVGLDVVGSLVGLRVDGTEVGEDGEDVGKSVNFGPVGKCVL